MHVNWVRNVERFCILYLDEFATPLSSPPSEEEGLVSAQLSQPAPPAELQLALEQSINQTQPTISDR